MPSPALSRRPTLIPIFSTTPPLGDDESFLLLQTLSKMAQGAPISAVPLDYLLQPFPVNLLTFSEDRLYLASYIHPPNEDTLFPYPDGPVKSPTKRSQRAGNGPQAVPKSPYKQPYYFTVDDTLLYNNFHHDFGPLHIGHLYRFALQFHEILGAKENKDRPVVFWSRADPRSKSPRPRA